MTTTVDRIGDLLERGMTAGSSMLDSLATRARRLPQAGMGAMLVPRVGACSCDIPPPCWMPRELRPVTSYVCPGGRAVLRLRVTNCSIERNRVDVDASGEHAGAVKVSPSDVSLDPLERRVVTATVDVEAETAAGTEREILLWVRGCVDHVVRWTVKVSRRGGDACHELDVEDCPDYVHHWYDHFYCARPCRRRQDDERRVA
jgi:hypothetical protein